STRRIWRFLRPRGLARCWGARRDWNVPINGALPVGAAHLLRSRLCAMLHEELGLSWMKFAARGRLPVTVHAPFAATRAIVRVVDDAVDHRGEMLRHADDQAA